MASLEVDLKDCDGFLGRVTTYAQLEKLFPASLCHDIWTGKGKAKGKGNAKGKKGKAKGKEKEESEEDDIPKEKVAWPTWSTVVDITEEDVSAQLTAYKLLIDTHKTTSKEPKRPTRMDDTIAARAAAVSTCFWPVTCANFGRDLGFFYKIGIYEHFMVERVKYRQPMLSLALGAVRTAFHHILDTCVEPHTLCLGTSTVTVSTWLFIDRLVPAKAPKAAVVNNKSFLLDFHDEKATNKHIAWLVALRSKVENYAEAWAVAEDEEEEPADRDLRLG